MIKKLIILLLISPPFCMGIFSPENSIKSDDKDELIRKLFDRVTDLETKYSELENKVAILLEKVFSCISTQK